MRELAVQAANGSNSASDTSLLNQEFNQLQNEVNRIQTSTTFNNVNVFSATATVFQIGANTSTNDRLNIQGTPLTQTATIGTNTITNGTAITAANDISSAIAAASAAAGVSITNIYNSTVDAINSSQKLSFAAKNDALNTLTAVTNAYQSTGVTTASATIANYVTDIQRVVGPTAVAGPLTLTVALSAAATGVTGSRYVVDGNPQNPTNPAIYATGTTVSVVVSIASVGTATTAGTLLATQTVTAGQANAQNAIVAIDSALTEVNNQSAIQGALQNRFSAVISNLAIFSQSQTASKSRIMDADFAAETANLSKYQILSQAGTAMLSQANQTPASVLSLLK
jgi:flagellin